MSEGALPRAVDRYTVRNTTLALVAGDLLALPIQAAVCYSSTSLTLHSALAVRIVEQGGPAVRADAAKHLPTRIGAVLALSAGRLPLQYVLVAVTNELRRAPTLESVRAALRATLRCAAALELERLAIPLLHVRHRLNDDDLLAVTLAALLDHLSGPTTIRHLHLVVDDQEMQARVVARRAAPLFDLLSQVGTLRAWEAQAHHVYAALCGELSIPDGERLARELLVQRYQALLQIIALLEPSIRERTLPGAGGLQMELRYCQSELDVFRDAGTDHRLWRR